MKPTLNFKNMYPALKKKKKKKKKKKSAYRYMNGTTFEYNDKVLVASEKTIRNKCRAHTNRTRGAHPCHDQNVKDVMMENVFVKFNKPIDDNNWLIKYLYDNQYDNIKMCPYKINLSILYQYNPKMYELDYNLFQCDCRVFFM
jgi:hypothetical protein